MPARKTRKKSSISVNVLRSGGRVNEYELEGEEPTVGDALTEAGIETSKNDRIRLNGELVTTDTIVENGDTITVGGKVSGGQA